MDPNEKLEGFRCETLTTNSLLFCLPVPSKIVRLRVVIPVARDDVLHIRSPCALASVHGFVSIVQTIQ
jgi:hypothetical protein